MTIEEVEIFKNLKISTMGDHKSEWFAYRNTNAEQLFRLFALLSMHAYSSNFLINPCLSAIACLNIKASTVTTCL